MDLIRLKLDLAASEKDFSVAQRTVQQVTLDLRRMETEHARLRGEQQNEIENLKTRIAALKADLENAHDNLLTVRSPYDGVLISLDQRSVGSFVQQGQILCQLSRKDAQPRARMTLNEAGLATLLFDLLTPDEEAIDIYTAQHRFNISLLAERLVHATKWAMQHA